MIYQFKFIYLDDKDLSVNIAEENVPAFFASLNNKQMYFDELNKMGFWTDLDKIRYMQSFQIPPKEQTEGIIGNIPLEEPIAASDA